MSEIYNYFTSYDFLDIFYYFGYFFIIIASIFSLIVSARVKSNYKKFGKIPNTANLTGADAARIVLMQNGVTNVRIERCSGELTDHYNPGDNTIYLSDGVFNTPSIASCGIAAHEAGHAVQHARNYFPIKIRTAIVPVTNIGSRIAMPLIIAGIIFSVTELALLGAFAFGLCVIFQLVTLPTEFNASRRAMEALNSYGFLSPEDISGARKMLTSAAMTYVAALAVSILQFLRLFSMAMNTRRRR